VLVPLLLLLFGVEVAEHELFRGVFETAASIHLQQHLAPCWRALWPRAGGDLTRDPLGLLLSASAAGIAVVYLLLSIFQAPGWIRRSTLGAAVVGLVLLPTLLVIRVGEAAGETRGQAPWLASVLSVAPGAPVVREAWSTSFRRDPPERLAPGPVTMAASLASWLAGVLGGSDPRRVLLVGFALLAVLFSTGASRDRGLFGWAALLSPPLALGVVFGSPDVLVLASLFGAWRLGAAARDHGAGAVLAVGAALVPRTLWSAPGLAASLRSPGKALCAAALSGLLVASVCVRGLAAWADLAPSLKPAPGVGLSNLQIYLGSASATASILALVSGGAFVAFLFVKGRGLAPLALLALGSLVGLLSTPDASALELATPLVLLLMAGADARRGACSPG
jgi:hypothetical protein